MKGALLCAGLVLVLLIAGGRGLANRFFAFDISEPKTEVLNTQMDALHEEIAATRSPDGFALLALVTSIAIPLILGVALLIRAEKTALHSDEVIRRVVRNGLSSRLMDSARLLDAPPPSPRNKVLRMGGSHRRQRRLPRLVRSDDDDEPESHSF